MLKVASILALHAARPITADTACRSIVGRWCEESGDAQAGDHVLDVKYMYGTPRLVLSMLSELAEYRLHWLAMIFKLLQPQ